MVTQVSQCAIVAAISSSKKRVATSEVSFGAGFTLGSFTGDMIRKVRGWVKGSWVMPRSLSCARIRRSLWAGKGKHKALLRWIKRSFSIPDPCLEVGNAHRWGAEGQKKVDRPAAHTNVTLSKNITQLLSSVPH